MVWVRVVVDVAVGDSVENWEAVSVMVGEWVEVQWQG